MDTNKYKYIEIIQDNIINRGTIYEFPHNWKMDYIGKPEPIECYHSAFIHSEDIKTYIETKGDLSGYKGIVNCECLYWDIDNSDINKALFDARVLIDRLKRLEVHKENIRVYYSGCKGFHVIYYCPELNDYINCNNVEFLVKEICSSLAEDIDSFDANIYDKTRVFRSANSINAKTHLYKIELSIDELFNLSIDEIKEKAKHQCSLPFSPIETKSSRIIELLKHSLDNVKSKRGGLSGEELLRGISEGFKQGGRNIGYTSLAGLLHSRGINNDLIISLLCAINNNSSNPLSYKEIETIVTSVSRYNINPLYIEPSKDDILTIGEAANLWYNIRKNSKTTTTGFPHIDKTIPYFDNGQLMLVVARPGVGKTTLCMQMLNNLSISRDEIGMFVSLEMPSHSLFVRTAIIEKSKEVSGCSTIVEVTEELLSSTSLKVKTIEAWKNIAIIDKYSLSLSQIESYYSLVIDKFNMQVSAVFIDYGGLIRGAEDYNKISSIARGLKELSKKLNTRVMCAVQLSRAAGDGTIPVTMDMLRDSGAWEEAADYIIGAWFSKSDQHRIHASILKNRQGERDVLFDIINKGLYYHTEDVKADIFVPSTGF